MCQTGLESPSPVLFATQSFIIKIKNVSEIYTSHFIQKNRNTRIICRIKDKNQKIGWGKNVFLVKSRLIIIGLCIHRLKNINNIGI